SVLLPHPAGGVAGGAASQRAGGGGRRLRSRRAGVAARLLHAVPRRADADAAGEAGPMSPLISRLHRDEAGNRLLLYVAGALLFVGILWAVIGAGARMVAKENLQNGADAAAYSAAVIRAKGMNLIAFCNLTLAALFGIVMVQRMVFVLLILAGYTAYLD